MLIEMGDQSQMTNSLVDMQAVANSIPTGRLKPYLDLCGGNLTQGTNYYLWNIEVSAAFWGSFHLLEVGLRNAIHQQLTLITNSNAWWETPDILYENEMKILGSVITKMLKRHMEYDPGQIIAELSFGFWVALLNKRYHRALWVNCLEGAFPNYEGKRHDLYMDLDRLRKLRNRIAHHEPIYKRNLHRDQDLICLILGHINPEVEKLLRNLSRVPIVLDSKQASILGKNPIAF